MIYSDLGKDEGVGLLLDTLEASADAVEIDDEDGYALHVNDAWRGLFGYQEGYAAGRHWESLFPGDEHIVVLEDSWARCLATGHSSASAVIRGADGAGLRYSVSRWLCRNLCGKQTAVVTIYRPMLAPQPPDETPGLLAAAVRSASDAFALFDVHGCLAYANPAFALLTGYGLEDASGIGWRALFPGASGPMDAFAARGGELRSDLEMTRKDGGTIPVAVTLTPYRIPAPSPSGVALRMQPLGVRVAEPGTAHGAVPRPWSSVEHDLRNLLAGIACLLELLKRSAVDQVALRRLDLVHSAVEFVNALLDEVDSRTDY